MGPTTTTRVLSPIESYSISSRFQIPVNETPSQTTSMTPPNSVVPMLTQPGPSGQSKSYSTWYFGEPLILRHDTDHICDTATPDEVKNQSTGIRQLLLPFVVVELRPIEIVMTDPDYVHIPGACCISDLGFEQPADGEVLCSI